MSDIKKCFKCKDHFHMDDGGQCAVCEIEYCDTCTIDNGISFSDLEENWLYFCEDCLELYKTNGIEYIQKEINGVVNESLMKEVIFIYEEWKD